MKGLCSCLRSDKYFQSLPLWCVSPVFHLLIQIYHSRQKGQSNPGKSCNDIYQINKASRTVSRNYWINTTTTGVHQVYCHMELECGGHKGSWMRIADLDTSRGDDCPSVWIKTTTNDRGQPPLKCAGLQVTMVVVILQSSP